MFKSKQDVDRHVRNILDRIKDDREKTSRGYQIARLYYEIRDYETAKRYLTNFLNLRENVSQAHKLLGQIYEATNENEKAIQSFKRSIELDSNQQDLVAKVGNLFISPRPAKVDRGKERDVENHIKLIQQLIAEKRTSEAFKKIADIESDLVYMNSRRWYQFIVENLHTIRKAVDQEESTFMIYHLLSIVRLCYQQLPSREIDSLTQTIYLLNEVLWIAENVSEKKPEWKIFLSEIHGQFFYLSGTLLFKKAHMKLVAWKEIVPIVSMCYLTSCSFPHVNENVDWYNLLKKENKLFCNFLHYSNYRYSQSGHMLHAIDKNTSTKPVLQYMHQLCATPWKKVLFSFLFPLKKNETDRDSFILSSKHLTNRSLTVPDSDDIARNDEIACKLFPDKLSEIVWMLLHRFPNGDVQSDYNLTLFPKLKYDVSDMNTVSIESLCQLDIECFLFATLRCSAIRFVEERSSRQPFLLPPVIDEYLCTPDQMEWWKFAFCFYANTTITDFGKMRRTLQRGLEVVRLAGNHGMSIHMLVHLAHCMEAKVKDVENTEYTPKQVAAIRDRAYHFWYQALQLIERIEDGGTVSGTSPKHLFYDDFNKIIDSNVILKLKEEIKLAVAKRLKEDGMFDMALEYFASLPSPWASYYMAQIFRLLGERESSSTEQRKALLEKSLSSLHITLDRIQGDKNHELNQYLCPFIKDIEMLIKQTDSDWEDDFNNSRYHTPQGKVDSNPNSRNYHNTSTPSNPSTSSARRLDLSVQKLPDNHLQPSPERLDSQIRQLTHSQESLLSVVLKRNEDLVKTNLELVAGLKECMETIKELKFEMYHRSAILGGLSTTTPRSFSTLASPYPAEVLANEMMSPGFYLDSSKQQPPHMIGTPPHLARELHRNPYFEDSMVPQPIEHHIGPMHIPHRRMPPNAGFGDPMIPQPGAIDESLVLSQLPGPGFFSPVAPKAPPKPPVPPSQHVDAINGTPVLNTKPADSSTSINVVFCSKVSCGNQDESILKLVSIGSLTQIIIESIIHPGSAEIYNVKDVYLQSSVNAKTVTCFHRAPGQQDRLLNWNFSSSQQASEFKQHLSSAINLQRPQQNSGTPLQTDPPASQAVPATSLPSWSAFSPAGIQASLKESELAKKSPEKSPVKPQSEDHQKSFEGNNSVEEFEPNVQFKPVIELPELVKVTTGEESETIVYSDRGKLYRYDSETSQWKERGLGEFKILKSGESKKYRFLMRRDQVLKICANHILTKEMKLAPLASSDKAWCWFAEDFADEEIKPEQFALKFKNKEMADKFKERFEKCQQDLSIRPEETNSEKQSQTKVTGGASTVPIFGSQQGSGYNISCNEPSKTSTPQNIQAGVKPFALGATSGIAMSGQDLFKFPLSSINQSSAKISGFPSPNPANIKTTVSSQEPAKLIFGNKLDTKTATIGSPGGFNVQTKPEAQTTQKVGPSTDQPKSTPLADLFKPKTGTWECSGCLCRNDDTVKICPACSTPKPGEKAPSLVSKVSMDSSKFSFGASGGFSIQTSLPSTTKTTTIGSPGGFKLDTKTSTIASPGGFNVQTKPQIVSSSSDQPKTTTPLADLFKPQTGTWECSGCLCRNEGTVKICPACSTPKPGEKAPSLVSKVSMDSSKFSFGASGGFSIQTNLPSKDSTKPIVFGSLAGTQPFNFASGKGSVIPPKPDAKTTPTADTTGCDSAKLFNQTFQQEIKEADKKAVETPPSGFQLFQPKAADEKATLPVSMDPSKVSLGAGTESKPFTFGSTGGFNFQPTNVKEKENKETKTNEASQSVLGTSNVFSAPDKDSTKPVTNLFTTPNKDSSKSQFGSNIFTPPAPVIAEKKDEKTTSVFSGKPVFGANTFTFAPTSSVGVTPVVKENSASKDSPTPFPNPFLSSSTSNSSGFTFSLTPSKPTTEVSSLSKTPVKNSGTAKPAASGQDSPQGAAQPDDLYINSEGDDSHIVFEPIIPLPEKVEVKTMEEDEDVLFNNRSKLYRFVDGEWKEKGIGVMKILEDKQTGARRVVMRRDQVHKVCCNHKITPDLTIKPMIKSEGKALVWFAVDFSGEEEKVEQFSARFKTAEIASDFKTIFEESKSKSEAMIEKQEGEEAREEGDDEEGDEDDYEDDEDDEEDDDETEDGSEEDEEEEGVLQVDGQEVEEGKDDVIFVSQDASTEEEIKLARKYLLPDHFYLYRLKPPCSGCIGCDEEDRRNITQSPPTSKTDKKSTVQDNTPSFSTLASTGGNLFSQKDSNTPVFGNTQGSENLFGSVKPVFQSSEPSFSSLASSSDGVFGQTNKAGNKPFKWSGAGQKLFNASPSTANNQDDDSVVPENTEDIHFEPVIPLPDLVEVVTGEEDWQVIFSQRSKLYRFDKPTSQWKERGTGDMKIMKYQDKDKYRLLFRREQVFKVVCNHIISTAINMNPMETSDRAWCWVAEDFSEEEGKVEKFAVKFKNIELAAKFKETFDDIIEKLNESDSVGKDKIEEEVNDEDTESGSNDQDDLTGVMFDKRVTLFTMKTDKWEKRGTGNLQVIYNDDVNGNAIKLNTDDKVSVCNHVVCQEYYITMERSKKTCSWKAVDFSTDVPINRIFKAQFSSTAAAEEFFTMFRYSLSLARESDLSQIGTAEDED